MSYSPEEILEEHRYRANLPKPCASDPELYPENEFTKLTVPLSKNHSTSMILSKAQAEDVISSLTTWIAENSEEQEVVEKDTYTLFWLTGDTQLVKGPDIASAMNNVGIGHGALAALDFHEKGDVRGDYVWSKEDREWKDKK